MSQPSGGEGVSLLGSTDHKLPSKEAHNNTRQLINIWYFFQKEGLKKPLSFHHDVALNILCSTQTRQNNVCLAFNMKASVRIHYKISAWVRGCLSHWDYSNSFLLQWLCYENSHYSVFLLFPMLNVKWAMKVLLTGIWTQNSWENSLCS